MSLTDAVKTDIHNPTDDDYIAIDTYIEIIAEIDNAYTDREIEIEDLKEKLELLYCRFNNLDYYDFCKESYKKWLNTI